MKTVLRSGLVLLLSATTSTMVASYASAADLLVDPPVVEYQPEPQGYGAGFVEGEIGAFTSRDNKKDQQRWSLRGTHNVGFGHGINVQGDAEYKSVTSCCSDDTTLAGTLHLYKRDPHNFAFGVYGHYAKNENQAKKEEDVFTYGVEGAAFMGNFTMLGGVGIGTISTQTQTYDTTQGRLEARYYATDNVRFDATLAIDSTQLINANESSLHLGFRGNWRLEDAPVTLFAGYRHEEEDLQVTGANFSPTSADVIYAGARFSWGSKSLKDEERNGALWNPTTQIGN